MDPILKKYFEDMDETILEISKAKEALVQGCLNSCTGAEFEALGYKLLEATNNLGDLYDTIHFHVFMESN